MAVLEKNKEQLVKNQLVWDNRVASTDLAVRVTDSTVILSGTVPTYHQKLSAEEDALGVPGIVYVENNITVSAPEGSMVLTDNEIKSSIDNMLEWDSRIDSKDITVSVDAGTVTLSGNVDAFWKRTAAENLAYSISGVTDVVNNLDIGWKESYTDESIAEDIKNSFKRSNVVNAGDIEIEVNKGTVTLRGTAPNLMVKSAAVDKAAYTGGVVAIDNKIEVV